MKFGSWSYDSFQVNLVNVSREPNTEKFIRNEQWNLEFALTRRHVLEYDCCPQQYPDVTFYICIRRKPLYYIYNLITPCILLCALSFLGFCMPYNVGVVKANLSVTLILSLTVFLLLVAQMMPRTSMEIPLIGQYYLAAMCLISVSTAMNVAVLNVNVCNREVPKWVKVFVLRYLATMCLHNCGQGCLYELKKVDDERSSMMRMRPSPLFGRRLIPPHDQTSLRTTSSTFGGTTSTSRKSVSSAMRSFQDVTDNDTFDWRFAKMEGCVDQIFKHLKAAQRKNDKKSYLRDEWLKVAAVLDRSLLVLFGIATITTTLSLLLQKPGDATKICIDRINTEYEPINI
uniref:Neuronal acetylcholine receptor subunit alpha-9-like n=1 Tax=Saccoglossus kowalevskii TaxID=10224 RepID=A0ABM0MDC7_SACKO|nr:PREDICTED: neuronal acetylcholine receptor subunit alpha-9-like [Saccoglossus kowalevskii]